MEFIFIILSDGEMNFTNCFALVVVPDAPGQLRDDFSPYLLLNSRIYTSVSQNVTLDRTAATEY
jgi:hypothetical protein